MGTFAVTGSGTWFDWPTMWDVLQLVPKDAVMINGMAAGGADCLARSYDATNPKDPSGPSGAGHVSH